MTKDRDDIYINQWDRSSTQWCLEFRRVLDLFHPTNSLDSTSAAAPAAATTTAANTTGANITAGTTYASSSHISIIPSDPSPVPLSSATLSQLSRDFWSNRPVGSLQEAVEIGAWELPPQRQANIMLKIYDLFRKITDAANTQVTWLSNFTKRNLDFKQLRFKWYSDFLKALDRSGRVREMMKQPYSAQQRKTLATKKVADLSQHNPKLQEILSDSSGSEKWMQLTAIANLTSRDPRLVKRWLNCAFIYRFTKFNLKSTAYKWYTFADFHEAKTMWDNGCPQLEEGIDYEAMGLKWYRGLLMPHSYYPGMDDHDHTNWLHTISPSVPPANHGTPPADHGIPVPPPSPAQSKMLPPPTPLTKGKEIEKNGRNVGGQWIEVAEDGSEDRTSTAAEKDTSTFPPAPTDKEAGTTPPVPTAKRPVRPHQLPPGKRLVQPQRSLLILSRGAPQ